MTEERRREREGETKKKRLESNTVVIVDTDCAHH